MIPQPLVFPLGYLLLFVPYAVALLLIDAPIQSYAVAWLGSLLILYLTLSGRVRRLPGGLTWYEQILRPFALTQVVFVGYTCLTSIFYVLDLHGYYYLSLDPLLYSTATQMQRVSAAQRYYVLGHAAIATGMLAIADYRRSGKWTLRLPIALPSFLLLVTFVATAAVPILLPLGLGQVAHRLQQITLVASLIALAQALPRGHLTASLLATGLLLYNLTMALLSGWKEEVIVVLLLLAVFLYPLYRKRVLAIAVLGFPLLLLVLPTYNQTFRDAAWFDDVDPGTAAAVALADVQRGGDQLLRNTWFFLTNRSTEISLFTRYLATTPDPLPFEGTQLVEQSLRMLVPRVLWPVKPNVEQLVMQRVYEHNVVERQSRVSAKPQYLVDGYLSGGALGVLLAGLAYGALATAASRLAERWFGGYYIGSGLVYTALFMVFWRGNSFEFFLNTVVWSFVLMFLAFVAGRVSGLIVLDPRLDR